MNNTDATKTTEAHCTAKAKCGPCKKAAADWNKIKRDARRVGGMLNRS